MSSRGAIIIYRVSRCDNVYHHVIKHRKYSTVDHCFNIFAWQLIAFAQRFARKLLKIKYRQSKICTFCVNIQEKKRRKQIIKTIQRRNYLKNMKWHNEKRERNLMAHRVHVFTLIKMSSSTHEAGCFSRGFSILFYFYRDVTLKSNIFLFPIARSFKLPSRRVSRMYIRVCTFQRGAKIRSHVI